MQQVVIHHLDVVGAEFLAGLDRQGEPPGRELAGCSVWQHDHTGVPNQRPTGDW